MPAHNGFIASLCCRNHMQPGMRAVNRPIVQILLFTVCQQVTSLTQLQELVVRKQPALLASFLPEVLLFQTETAPSVRRYVATFIADAADAPSGAALAPAALAGAAQCITALAADSALSVAKQAVRAAQTLLTSALAAYAAQPQEAGAREGWAAVLAMQQAVCDSALEHAGAARALVAGGCR